MATVPTTHMWGGDDAGYSLKLKLSQMLLRKYVDPMIEENRKAAELAAKEEADAANTDETQGNAEDQADPES